MEGKHIANYRVRAHDVSADKHMHLPALLRMLQEASLQHAILLGASIWDTRMANKTWVLIKKEMEVFSYPLLNAVLRVETYPSDFDKFFAYREWQVFDQENNLVAEARSQWAVIHLETRKMDKLPKHLFDIQLPKSNLAKTNFKIRFEKEASSVTDYVINRFDLDWNNHLNNSKLIEYMLAAIPQEQFKSFRHFKILFKSEVLLGDHLQVSFYQEENEALLKATKAHDEKIVALISVSTHAESDL